MSLMVGIGKGAKNGILIKNAEALEEMHKVNAVSYTHLDVYKRQKMSCLQYVPRSNRRKRGI